jgi:hypothetical protein
MVSRTSRFRCEAITPRHEDSARSTIGQRRQRKVSKFHFDPLDQCDVVDLRPLGGKFSACSVALEHTEPDAQWWDNLTGDRSISQVAIITAARELLVTEAGIGYCIALELVAERVASGRSSK